jgi:transcriptional regulator with XRE-family HTH domain
MATPFPHNAVSKFGAPRVRVELDRRGWKQAELAKKIGISSDTLTNILIGTNPGIAAWLRIEDVLLLPLGSSLQEFIARQKDAGRLADYQAALVERMALAFTVLETTSAELQQLSAVLVSSLTAVNKTNE